jgi:AraC-like DNA-binding protein
MTACPATPRFFARGVKFRGSFPEMGQKMPELAKPDPMSKRGRKAFVPTVKQRDRVMLLTAGGLTEPAIAAVLGCCERTLRNCFKAELETGRGVKRAQNLERLEAAAKRGNVSAMKALAAAFDRGEHQEQIAGETAAVRRERAEAAVRERMSKRQLLQRDALTAGQDTDWGTDLLPSADWQQH